MKNIKFGILSAIVLAALASPMSPRVLAQSNSSATNASPSPAQVVDQLLAMVESQMVALAEAMPADKYNFAPTNGNFHGVRTFGEQVQHVIRANYGLFGAGSSLQPTGVPKMDTLKTKDQIVAALKDSFAFAHRATATLDQQNALEEVKPVEGIKTRAGIMLLGVIHTNDHVGQLVVYLRMNGVIPPFSMPQPKK